MSDLLVRALPEPDAAGRLVAVAPEAHGLGYVGLEALRLGAGDVSEVATGPREACLVPLSGTCAVSGTGGEWPEVGGRADVWAGPPHGLYLPPEGHYRVEATSALELAIAFAPAERGVEPYVVTPDEIEVEVRGSGVKERRVHPIVMDARPAESILVVEVLTPGGHWSSYPPHKHDEDDLPRESLLEEIYYHRISPEQGFGLQRVYTADRSLDETLAFGDGDTVLVPRGYHTVSAPPGYDLYYLNVMAGPTRAWTFADDPDHHWQAG